MSDTDDIPYPQSLGHRLRAIRVQQGLSLHGVEKKSGGRWKGVVIGSYERGSRAVTVQRLAELADLRSLAVIYDDTPTRLAERLISWGVLNPGTKEIDLR
jgi:transcriptional regulator with XRE-family HTH domain